VRACVEAAVAAPSIHNSQPWRLRVGPHGIDVLADRTRLLSVVDPDGRELFISLGAAVFNLRVAMLNQHRLPLRRFFPDRGQPDLVARVTPGPYAHATDTAAALYQAIPRRHTNRRPFADAAVPQERLAELRDAATCEGAVLTVADDLGREAILSLIRTAETRWRHDPAYWLELAEWSGATGTRTDGVPAPAFGPWSAAGALPLRDFGLVMPVRRRQLERFEAHPTLAVIRSLGDGPEAWLRTGEALQRVLLTATARGLASTPMTQPLEFSDLRQLLNDPAEGLTAQVILRLGYGPLCAATPRRPLDEVVVEE
jgi:nitroreductase